MQGLPGKGNGRWTCTNQHVSDKAARLEPGRGVHCMIELHPEIEERMGKRIEAPGPKTPGSLISNAHAPLLCGTISLPKHADWPALR